MMDQLLRERVEPDCGVDMNLGVDTIQLAISSQVPSYLIHPNTSQAQERDGRWWGEEFLMLLLFSGSYIWAAVGLREGK